MEAFLNSISLELIIAFSVNFFFILILFLINFSTRSKLKKLRTKYYRFMNGLSDRNIEQLLDECISGLRSIEDKNREIDNHLNHIERNILQCVQKFGVVRYNAFDNVGSDLSFSIALLDYNDNGFVISSLYSRDNSLTYGKPVVGGKSKYTLSAEEIQAIETAKKTHRERLYTD